MKYASKFNLKIIKAALITILLMGIFPPWLHTFSAGETYNEKPASYSVIFSPPQPKNEQPTYGVRLDFQKLFLQWFLVAVIAAGIVVMRGNRDDLD